jgi:hypothetical protein
MIGVNRIAIRRQAMGFISQTFRVGPTLDQKSFYVLQKWLMLTNEKKHQILKEVIADGLNSDKKTGTDIKQELAAAINKAVSDADIVKLKY